MAIGSSSGRTSLNTYLRHLDRLAEVKASMPVAAINESIWRALVEALNRIATWPLMLSALPPAVRYSRKSARAPPLFGTSCRHARVDSPDADGPKWKTTIPGGL